MLGLARDYLIASGGRLRAEDASRIVADLPDGNQVVYTDAPGHTEDGALLLVPGSATATAMIAAIEARSRFGALRLIPASDPIALATRFSAPASGKKIPPEVGDGVSREEGKLILHWEKAPVRVVVSRSWESTCVEGEYRLAGRDHFGRIEDTLRVAVDPSGDAKRTALTLSQASAAQSSALTSTDRDLLEAVLDQMDRRLQPQVAAAVSFLRLRSQNEYRRRVEIAQGIAERARREQPEEARQTEQALKQELAALGAVFAVEVEASVAAAWVIYSPMADVSYHLPGGSSVEVALDLGRAAAEPLACAFCQRLTREVTICAYAHILCPLCRDPMTGTCVICAGAEPSRRAGRSGSRQATRVARKDFSTALTLEGLSCLGPEMWRACVGWLLERQGYTLTSLPSRNLAAACWRGVDTDGKTLLIHALRGDATRVISERDAVETAWLAREQRLQHALLLAAGAPTRAVRALAESSGVRIIDGEALRAQLTTLVGSVDQQQATAQAEMKTRARAAISAHAAMQRALAAATKRIEAQPPRPGAPGSATPAQARAQLRATRTSADQAFLAWETLLADWLEAFGSTPAHDGTLPILVDASAFTSLRERAAHLGGVLSDLLRDLAATPTDGELGYSAWRAAIAEEARLRCVALAAQLQIIDPAQWADFDAARSQARETDAREAEVAARRASARADKAQSQVTRLTG